MEGRECNVCHRHYKNARSLASHKYGIHGKHEKFNTPPPAQDNPAAPAASAPPALTDTPAKAADVPAAPATPAAPAAAPAEEKLEVETHETFKTDLPPLPDMGTAAPSGATTAQTEEKKKAASTVEFSLSSILSMVQGKYNESINISTGHGGAHTIEDIRNALMWTDKDTETLSKGLSPAVEKYAPWLLSHYVEIAAVAAIMTFAIPKVFAYIELGKIMKGDQGNLFAQQPGNSGGGDPHASYWANYGKGAHA